MAPSLRRSCQLSITKLKYMSSASSCIAAIKNFHTLIYRLTEMSIINGNGMAKIGGRKSNDLHAAVFLQRDRPS